MISKDGEKRVEILYKYVSAEQVQTCLPEVGDGTLRATQPSVLNDPLQCRTLGRIFRSKLALVVGMILVHRRCST